MKSIIELISEKVKEGFAAAGYDEGLGMVSVSNRPDLCEFQCNGAMAGAKKYHKSPMIIAAEIEERLRDEDIFEKIEAVSPGFLNITVSGSWLADVLTHIAEDEKLGVNLPPAETVIVDYGGPNVAKPLHVGHLRSAVIGESVKRIFQYMGHNTIGDIHMGDWGLQMGLIITELRARKPDLPYFDQDYKDEYPAEAPFTIGELEEIYPTASEKSKNDENFRAQAMDATLRLQQGERGYKALWDHIISVSVADLKRNYDKLKVNFELWNGESTVQPLIPDMVDRLKRDGYARLDQGALVVDVKEETDTKEMPPCMILKSDGASLYNTTDLATIIDRMDRYRPGTMVYLTDKRQNLYFEQIFRCARKTKMVDDDTRLIHIGFGTVNGPGGKPFKTREGGVMRLEYLIKDIYDRMLERILENRDVDRAEAEKIAAQVSLAAIKYGDLSNQPSKDYSFDVDKFTSSEGNTGPYILYTIVRIGSILKKYREEQGGLAESLIAPVNPSQKALMLELCGFAPMLEEAYREVAPNKICGYIYSLSNAFNSFYHENRILTQENEEIKKGHIKLLEITRRVLEVSIDLLGFEAPERM